MVLAVLNVKLGLAFAIQRSAECMQAPGDSSRSAQGSTREDSMSLGAGVRVYIRFLLY